MDGKLTCVTVTFMPGTLKGSAEEARSKIEKCARAIAPEATADLFVIEGEEAEAMLKASKLTGNAVFVREESPPPGEQH